MTRLPWTVIVCACWASQFVLPAQTALDLRTQAKNVDFTQAATTKPNKTGASLPTSCSVGETYFLTGAQAGQNLFLCTAVNTWTQMTVGSSGSFNPMTTLGDVIYAGAGGAATRLSGNTTTVRQFLTQTGTGSISAAPAWSALAPADVTTGLGYTPEARSSKGVANGYAPLDSTGKVPAANLPASSGTGTVTNSAGALTNGAIVVGNGANDARASTVTVDSNNAVSATGGFSSIGAGSGTLALSGGTTGTVSQTVQPTAGTWTFTWPSSPAGAHQFLTTDSNGIASFARPSMADLALTGTIEASALPTPTTTTLGGVHAGDCSGTGHIASIGTDGSVICSADAAATMTAHAATHASDGSDPVTLAESQITNLTADLAGKQATLGYTPESTINKGIAGGYAPLNAFSQVPLTNLPVAGTGATLPTLAATPTVGNCLNWSANGVHDAGVACGSGSGGGLADPGSNGMLKRTALNTTAAAVAGTDYYAPGTGIASSDLPFPGASAKGGVLTTACLTGYAVDYYQVNGTPHCVSLSALGYNPLDTTSKTITEEFCGSSASSGQIGKMGWLASGTVSVPDTAAGHVCAYSVSTSAVAANIAFLRLGPTGTKLLPSPAVSTATNWEAKWVFETPATLTNVRIMVGLKYSNSDDNATFVGLRYFNSTSGCTLNAADGTNWLFQSSDGTAPNAVAAQAIVASTWYALRARNTGTPGHVLLSMATAGGAYTAESDMATNLPPFALGPVFWVETCDTTAKSILPTYFAFTQGGLAQ